jgi:hypothetical protein
MKKTKKKLFNISVIMPLRGDLDFSVARMLAVQLQCASAGISADWVLVDDGAGFADTLAAKKALKKVPIKILRNSEPMGNWASYFQGCLVAPQEWCLFLPLEAPVELGSIAALRKKTPFTDWIIYKRGAAPAVASQLLWWLWGLPPMDLGSMMLGKKEIILEAAAHYPSTEIFLGAKTLRLALLAQKKVRELPAQALDSKLDDFLALGEYREIVLKSAKRLGVKIGACLGLIWIGLNVAMPRSATLGLFLLMAGVVALAFFTGDSRKTESLDSSKARG